MSHTSSESDPSLQRSWPYLPAFGIAAALCLLVALAAQYPLSATFPMGGDAAAYIDTAQRALRGDFSALTRSWYPIADILLIAMRAWPQDWPLRFIAWAALGQIAAGVSLGWFLYKIFNWQTAAAGMAFWALTPILVTTHFEDGTIAQLWSYIFIFLFLYFFIARKPWPALFTLYASFLAHPVTALALFTAVAASLPAHALLWKTYSVAEKRAILIIGLGSGLLLTAIIVRLYLRPDILNSVTAAAYAITPWHYVRSAFAPAFLLAPLGLGLTLEKFRQQRPILIMLLASMAVFALLGMNNLLGINVWAKRMQSLIVIVAILGAAVAWPRLMRVLFATPLARAAVSVLFFAVLGASAWHNNAPVYAYYESPSRYARIHPDEVAALYWLRDNLPPGSTIASTKENRHSEWIPILTGHAWIGLDEAAALGQPYYEVYFLKRERAPGELEESGYDQIVYQNQNAVVFSSTH